MRIKLNVFFPLFLVVFVFAYWPAIVRLVSAWDTGENNYCYLVGPMFIYICWEMRGSFNFGQVSWSYWGLPILAISTLVILVSELGSLSAFVYFGLWGLIFSAALLIYGEKIHQLVFPFSILLFTIPVPPFLSRYFTFKLKLISSSISVDIMRLLGLSVYQEGNVIDLGFTALQVVDACSGMRYIIPMILMSLFIGYLFSKRKWQQIIIFLSAVPVSIFLNVLRIVGTALLYNYGYQEYAEGFFHDFEGWLFFMVGTGLLVILSAILGRVGGSAIEKKVEKGSSGAHEFLGVPLSAMVLSCAILALGGGLFRVLPHSLHRPERVSFEHFPEKIDIWQGERLYLDEDILESLGADDYIKAWYISNNGRDRIHLLLPYYEYQVSNHSAHAPQACLLGGGWNILKSEERKLNIGSEGSIRFQEHLMEKNGQKMISYHFFLQRGRVIISPWVNKFYLITDAITRGRTDGALVRLEAPIPKGCSIDSTRNAMDQFLKAIWKILPKYVPSKGESAGC